MRYQLPHTRVQARKIMRIVVGLIAAGLLLAESGGRSITNQSLIAAPNTATTNLSTWSVAKPRVDFDTQLKPIFKSKCMPCHFEGGKMYHSLPFDKPDTIRKLGTKLFTRIKQEDDRRLIEDFLNQSP